jgi:type I restriction enzyme M protein
MTTHDIVGKLWNLCNILKDDGVTYHQYVTELTYLLFLKMAEETGTEHHQLPSLGTTAGPTWRPEPPRSGWSSTRSCSSTWAATAPGWCRRSSPTPAASSSKPATLSTLVAEIDKLDWYSASQEGLGDLYEGLLEKNANEKKSGAGQYFTPRHAHRQHGRRDAPDPGRRDPGPGRRDRRLPDRRQPLPARPDDPDGWTEAQQRKYRRSTFYGMEHVQDTHRLALMNLMLHGIDSDPQAGTGIRYGDTLSPEGQALPKATLILTNPPFGTKKGGGLPSRTDFTFPTSNKQFCFLQHIYRGLKPGGAPPWCCRTTCCSRATSAAKSAPT